MSHDVPEAPIPMAYVLVTIKKILDQNAFDEYAEKVRPILRESTAKSFPLRERAIDANIVMVRNLRESD